MSYQHYKDFVAGGRNKRDRPVANNTRAIDHGESVAIRLHQTDVVTFHENGDIELNSGGWRTVTTKDRFGYQDALSVFSRSGTWFVTHNRSAEAVERRLRVKFGLPVTKDDWPVDFDYGDPSDLRYLGSVGPRGSGYGFWGEVGEVIGFPEAARIMKAYNKELRTKTEFLFFDGIRFTARGRCVNGIPAAEAERKLKVEEKLRKRIIEFAKGAVDHLDEGPHPFLNRGDCFFCQMRTAEEPGDSPHGGKSSFRGKPLGDAAQSHDHLLSHIEESYYPSALLRNAMDEQPYGHAGKRMFLGVRGDNPNTLTMGGLTDAQWGNGRNHDAERVATAVYQYAARRLLGDREIRSPFGGMSNYKFPIKERTEV